MTKIVIPQKKKDKLNGWQRMDTAKEDEVIDIVDASGGRHADSWYRSGWGWQGVDSCGFEETIDHPCYWMKVKLPLFK